jgi:hypothetical protein
MITQTRPCTYRNIHIKSATVRKLIFPDVAGVALASCGRLISKFSTLKTYDVDFSDKKI